MRNVWWALLVAGCGRSARVESLVEAGWLGEACTASVGLESAPPALLDAHLKGSRELVIGVIPGSRYPNAPAYGRTVLLAQLALNESEPPAPLRGVTLALQGDGLTLESCPSCGQTWLAEHLGLPAPKGRVPGLLGLLALPFTMVMDLVFVPIRALQAAVGEDVVPWLSGAVVSGMATHTIAIAEDGQCLADAPCTDTWIGAQPTAEASAVPDDTLAVTWRWLHADCEVRATWTLPLPAGTDLPTRLAEVAQKPISLEGAPATWSVRAR